MSGSTKRTDYGRAKESRRARSSSSLAGVRGEAVSGHPALFVMAPALELGRLPRGGGYPAGFVQAVAPLLGCADVSRIVHVCSGSVRARFTIDLRPEARPAVVADVRWLPLRPGTVHWIMCDPPYSERHAQELWTVGDKYPTPAVLLRECASALRAGGRLAFLHFVVPRLPAGLRRVGTYGVSTGPGYRMRALTIAERTHDELELVGLEA